MSKPRMPANLARSGKALWRQTIYAYDLRADELRVLEDACREADLVDRLEHSLGDAPTFIEGARGQEVINPLFGEIRQHRGMVAGLLAKLKLSDETDEAKQTREEKARDAAKARWAA